MKGGFDQDTMREFKKEVTMLDKFRSEYIVHFYGAVFIPNCVCIVTEFAQFGSLQDLIKKRKEDPISMKLRIKILLDSAKGIEYLHSNGILHRDIKPGNILVMSLKENEKVNAKLTDFGSSRNIDMLKTNLTLTGSVGTPAYMAPEVMKRDKYNEKADIYSFAITMYECFNCCDCYPKSEFQFPWDVALFISEGKRRPKPETMTNEQYQLIEKCWKEDLNDRIGIRDVVSVLDEMIEMEQLKEKKRQEEEIIQREMKQIEEWTKMKIGNKIFDSEVDNWNQNLSEFDQRIINKSNLIFLIEDDDGNKFGCYIRANIDKYESYINDPHAILFSSKSNGRLNGMLKFDIKEPQYAYFLNNKTNHDLFGVGDGWDLLICKDIYKKKSYCEQQSFNYDGSKKTLCGKRKISPKRLSVFQLIEKKIIDLDEMKQIEEWTSMKIGGIIFDSDVDDWNVNTSVFDERIINKRNLIFIIEDDDDNKFGGYINAIIDKYGYITDSKSFVFSLKSNGRLNGMLKFDITESQHAFLLDNQSNDDLFGIGKYGRDIHIRKENNKNKSHCYQNSFTYNGIQNALCGKSYPDRFTTERITAFQLI